MEKVKMFSIVDIFHADKRSSIYSLLSNLDMATWMWISLLIKASFRKLAVLAIKTNPHFSF